MKKTLSVIVIVAMCCSLAFGVSSDAKRQGTLGWSELPPLPPATGQQEQNGVASPFAGVHNAALIVAGGANFQEGRLWEGGKKIWWDDVFVLTKTETSEYQWITDPAFKLARPIAYGVSISTSDGIVCIGGCDAEKNYSDVFLLKWNAEAKKVEFETLPSLPKPLSFMEGSLVGDTIYIAGGYESLKNRRSTKNFLALDLSKKGTSGFAWEELEPWPGPARYSL